MKGLESGSGDGRRDSMFKFDLSYVFAIVRESETLRGSRLVEDSLG